MPRQTILEIPSPIQDQILKELRQARYGHLLAYHILLLCAANRPPSEIAAFLFCSRSSVYRTVEAYRSGKLVFHETNDDDEPLASHAGRSYIPSLQRSLLSILKSAPGMLGWCRTRWSAKTLSLELEARRGVRLSQEKVRRWLHSLGYVWKRARHVAKDDDPERISKLARIRHLIENVGTYEKIFFIDELDIHLLPKIGYEWMMKGTQSEIMTPGQNQKRYLAGALDYLTGKMSYVIGERKNRWLVIDLWRHLDSKFKKESKIYVVADNDRIHKAKAVMEWLARHPRFEIVWLPSYCPRANPIERTFGEVHDKCTRNHKRQEIEELVADVKWHMKSNGPWKYILSRSYYTPEVDAAVRELADAGKMRAA